MSSRRVHCAGMSGADAPCAQLTSQPGTNNAAAGNTIRLLATPNRIPGTARVPNGPFQQACNQRPTGHGESSGLGSGLAFEKNISSQFHFHVTVQIRPDFKRTFSHAVSHPNHLCHPFPQLTLSRSIFMNIFPRTLIAYWTGPALWLLPCYRYRRETHLLTPP